MTRISYIQTGAEQTGLKFEKFPEVARALLEKRMRSIIAKLESGVLAAVPRRTGRLAAEVESFVDSTDDGIVGKVKVVTHGNKNEIIRALSLEFGAHGTANVKAYNRGGKAGLLSRLTRGKDGMVSAYSRQVNVSEVDFMRGPLRDIRDDAVAELKQALDEAAAV